MKALFSLITLFAIAFAYVFSATLYMQGELLTAYLLILASITSLTFWIKSHDLLRVTARNKA
jgi:hypothetical protein